jgi:hypothetical protein
VGAAGFEPATSKSLLSFVHLGSWLPVDAVRCDCSLLEEEQSLRTPMRGGSELGKAPKVPDHGYGSVTAAPCRRRFRVVWARSAETALPLRW